MATFLSAGGSSPSLLPPIVCNCASASEAVKACTSRRPPSTELFIEMASSTKNTTHTGFLSLPLCTIGIQEATVATVIYGLPCQSRRRTHRHPHHRTVRFLYYNRYRPYRPGLPHHPNYKRRSTKMRSSRRYAKAAAWSGVIPTCRDTLLTPTF